MITGLAPSEPTARDGGTGTPTPGAVILVVEDEAILALDLSDQLQDMGYRVCAIADRGETALALAERHRPDLVLMDIVIKGALDGVATSERLAATLRIPVVFLTAYGDDLTIDRAAHTAPYGYITKPYKARELRAAIEVALFKSRSERRLRESEHWYEQLLQAVADGLIATDAQSRVRYMNPAAERLLQRSVADSMGEVLEPLLRTIDLASGAAVVSPLARALGPEPTSTFSFGRAFVLPDGERVPVDSSAAPIRGDDGSLIGAVLTFRDIRTRLETEAALRNSEERFRSAFDLAPSGMMLISLDGHFIECNAAMLKLLGCSADDLAELSHEQVTHPNDVEQERQSIRMLFSDALRSVQFEKRYRRGGRDFVWTLASVSLLSDREQPLCLLYQVHDLSRHKEYEYQLMRLAHYDGLTGLNNRSHMREALDAMLMVAGQRRSQLAVAFLDLDHFKQINDTLGHDAGDQVLQVVAQRLLKALGRADTVGRLGGDEFVVVLPDVAAVTDIAAALEAIRAEFSEPVRLGGQRVAVGLSIGVSVFPVDGQDSVTLLRCADSALYHAKELGRGGIAFYEPEMTRRLTHRMRTEVELRHAIASEEFVLHYQPIVPLGSSGRLGVEALLRWQHPERGLLLPAEFIDIAENSGLIVPLGPWILRTACRAAARWGAISTRGPIEVSVNISVRQFATDDLVAEVRDALLDSGLAPELLCLEITERLWLRYSEENLRILERLKALGVQIALDDFGVGYSSFSYIERLQPDKIKIDGSLVRQCAVDPRKGTIVRAIVSMGHELKATVVAECVESEAQRDFLLAENCDFAQGYLFGASRPESEVMAMLAELGPPA